MMKNLIHLYDEYDQQELVFIFKQLLLQGYVYVARDEGAVSVSCYSAKPKKYKHNDLPSFWGYRDKDLPDAKPAYPISYHGLEIRSDSKSALLIEDWLKKYEVKT